MTFGLFMCYALPVTLGLFMLAAGVVCGRAESQDAEDAKL